MKVGQRVRFKSTSSAARYWKIPHDAQGTVMCSYQLLASNRAAPDRLDVHFTPQLVIWGGAAVTGANSRASDVGFMRGLAG